jgi:hypothetical protein
MPFTIRPFRRVPVHCAVTYNAGLFLTLPRASCSGIWSLFGGATKMWPTAVLVA